MRSHRLSGIIALLFLLIPAFLCAERVVINTGHVGSVREMALTEDGDTLITVGDDGTLREFHARTGDLITTMQVSPFRVTGFAMHPTMLRVAILETDGVSISRLSVWDLSEQTKLFSLPLKKNPLQFDFSPKGSYLVYTTADWNSVTVVDANDGSWIMNPDEPDEPLFEGFGTVSAFLISSSEKTIVSYLPTGWLQYRELATGNQTARIQTIPDLTDMHFFPPRHAIGRQGDTITAIDILTGEDVANKRVENIRTITVDHETNEILVLHENYSGDPKLSLLAFQSNRLIDRYALYSVPADALVRAFLVSNRNVYLGLISGALLRQTRFATEPEPFSSNILSAVDDVLPGNSTLITTQDAIVTVHFDVFPDGTQSILTFSQPNPLYLEDETLTPEDTIDDTLHESMTSGDIEEDPLEEFDVDEEPVESHVEDDSEDTVDAENGAGTDDDSETLSADEEFARRQKKVQFIKSVGIRLLATDFYLLFDDGGTAGKLAYFSPVSGLIESFGSYSPPPIVSLDVHGFNTLTVNSEGKLSIANILSEDEIFSYERSGLRAAIFAEEPFIIAAGQKSDFPRTTTVLINTDTYETVPLHNQNTLTFAIAYEPVEGAVYSANINRGDTPSRTEITKHYGANLENVETVYSVEGEFFDASIATRRGLVFVSVGGVNLLKRSRRAPFVQIEDAQSIPRSVAVYDEWLFSINRDSSISLWRIDTGLNEATFSLLENGGWVAITGSGELIAAASEAEEFFNTYR